MDALVEDVSTVMDLLACHHAQHLVNENVVFERLETESSTSSISGQELVNRVVQSFLIEFGLALPEGPDIVPLPAVAAGPSSNRICQAGSPEVFVLSPATVQALDEPYSPLPQCLDSISNTDDGKDIYKASNTVPEDSKQAAIPQNGLQVSPEISSATEPAPVNHQSTASSSVSGVSLGAIPKQPKAKDIVLTDALNTAMIFEESMEGLSQVADVDSIEIQEHNVPMKLKFSPSNRAKDGHSSPGKRSRNEPSNESKRLKTSPSSRFTSSNSDTKRSPKSERVAANVATLSDMFPEADPEFLWNRCEDLSDDESFNALIVQMLSDNDYPRVLGPRVNRLASAAAGSSKVTETQETPINSSSAKVPSSYVPVANSYSVPVTSTTVASTSKPIKPEPLASTSKGPASTSKPVKSEPLASTSKAPVVSLDTAVKKDKIQVSSLSEVKHRLSLENGNEAAAVLREPWEDQLDTFVQIFPDADPSFLEEKARLLFGKEDELRVFVAEALEKKDYPSRKDWQWRQDQLALQKKYTEEFSIPNFLEIIPDPFTYFADQKRNPSHQVNQATMFLRNKYRKLRVADITSAFSRNKYNLTLTCRELDNWKGPELKSRRTHVDYDLTRHDGGKGINVPFLQEIAFIENEKKIIQYLNDKKTKKEAAFQKAKERGELLECQCCFDNEVMLEDIRACSEGHHIFCVTCLQRSSEQRIGDGHTSFPCLADCSSEFNLQTLREILKPTVFSRLVQRKQVEEVKAAGIEDLVQCPFCDFCNIPPKEDKIFRCLNPDCMKESCRLCKELSHVPLRCDEVEKKSEVEMRTYIENQMTEALVRTCWKCARKFVKEDGCNKMTCQCGALMCYICRQPVKDYSHFNGQGGDAYEKCPLWSNNDELHVAAVAKVAEEAKKEALARDPSATLKHDPTAILPKATGRPRHPHEAHGRDLARWDHIQQLRGPLAAALQQLNQNRARDHHERRVETPEERRLRRLARREALLELRQNLWRGGAAAAAAGAPPAAARPPPAAAAGAPPAAARPAPAAAAGAPPAAARPAPVVRAAVLQPAAAGAPPAAVRPAPAAAGAPPAAVRPAPAAAGAHPAAAYHPPAAAAGAPPAAAAAAPVAYPHLYQQQQPPDLFPHPQYFGWQLPPQQFQAPYQDWLNPLPNLDNLMHQFFQPPYQR